jgi:hypothetical protein
MRTVSRALDNGEKIHNVVFGLHNSVLLKAL